MTRRPGPPWPPPSGWTGGRALRLAHRGDRRRGPENSLAALRAALVGPGCDGLELDVRLSADGTPVLAHDETLERVQHRPGRVAELTTAELAATGIATLAEVLDAVPRTAFLDVEVKGDVREVGAIVAVLEAARGPGLEAAVIASFVPATLRAFSRARPGWPRWLNTGELEPATIRLAKRLGCRGISAEWRAISPATAEAVAAAGLVLAAWTVRRRATARRLDRLGLVAICVEGTALDG